MTITSLNWASTWATVGKSTKAKSGAAITAVARDANYLDLFMIDNNGVCQTISRDNGVWATSWTQIDNSQKTTSGGPTTAIYRDASHVDLFMADRYGPAVKRTSTSKRSSAGFVATTWTSDSRR